VATTAGFSIRALYRSPPSRVSYLPQGQHTGVCGQGRAVPKGLCCRAVAAASGLHVCAGWLRLIRPSCSPYVLVLTMGVCRWW
jgi:hypothetical protein